MLVTAVPSSPDSASAEAVRIEGRAKPILKAMAMIIRTGNGGTERQDNLDEVLHKAFREAFAEARRVADDFRQGCR